METQVTVRLSATLCRDLDQAAHQAGKPRSEIVRQAVSAFLAPGAADPADSGRSMYDRTRDLIGIGRSGVPDLGLRHRDHLLRRLRSAQRNSR